MDWQIAQTTMATIEQIIVDGANGVTQAPRLVSFIPWWQIVTALLIVIAGICVRTRPRVRAWMILATCLAYVPGYREVFPEASGRSGDQRVPRIEGPRGAGRVRCAGRQGAGESGPRGML